MNKDKPILLKHNEPATFAINRRLMKFNTKTIHGGQENIDPAFGSVMPPIYQTTTYSQSTPGGHKGYEYSRSANPTRTALEKSMASIENGKFGIAFMAIAHLTPSSGISWGICSDIYGNGTNS